MANRINPQRGERTLTANRPGLYYCLVHCSCPVAASKTQNTLSRKEKNNWLLLNWKLVKTLRLFSAYFYFKDESRSRQQNIYPETSLKCPRKNSSFLPANMIGALSAQDRAHHFNWTAFSAWFKNSHLTKQTNLQKYYVTKTILVASAPAWETAEHPQQLYLRETF